MDPVNYTKEGVFVNTSKDGVIIRKHFHGLAAGRSIDINGVTAKVVPCGLPIATDGKGSYKPVYPTEGFVLPAGYHYCGVCGATVLVGKPVSIMDAGAVNEFALLAFLKEVCPTPNRVLTIADLAAVKTALPHIIWEKDEVADATSTTITDVVYIDSQEDFTANFSKLADFYTKNPDAPGNDGTYPNVHWAVANFSGLAGTMVITYNGTVKATIPGGVTTASTYVIIDPLSDLGVAYESFDLSKLVITVEA